MRQEKIRYSYSFFDKFGVQTKLPNSNDLVLRCRDTQQLVLMKDIQVLSSQYEQTLATLDYQKKLSHQQLLGLLDYHPQPDIHKFIVLYQYCQISLLDQFQNRLSQRRYFEEPQLWSIFTSLVFGLAYLQQQNVGHGSISLVDCFLNQQGFIKISDPTCASSNPYNILKGYFYAPQILRCLVQQTGQQINIFKSDMFALGCCMLQLSLMRQINEIFDYENGLINKGQFKCLLSDLASLGLSKQYVNFINQTLLLDSHQRPDFITLKSEVFNLLSLQNTEQSQQLMRGSYGIKSSISSLCRSKGQSNMKQVIKKDIQNLQIKKIDKMNFSLQDLLKNTVCEKNGKPLVQIQLSSDKNLADFTFFKQKPNVDHLFGNMKKSINLDSDQIQTENMNPSNNNIKQKNKQKREQKQNFLLNRINFLKQENKKQQKNNKKVMQEITSLQENIQTIQFGLQRKRRVRQSQINLYRESFHSTQTDNQISQKALVIKKQMEQLFKQSPQKITKQSYLQQKTAYSSQIKRSSLSPLQQQQMYTDPQFLQMMKADVQLILHKRMNKLY